MHLTEAHIGNYLENGVARPPFPNIVEFKFDKRVNVLIGPNASGKTTALRDISRMFGQKQVFPVKVPLPPEPPPSVHELSVPPAGPTVGVAVSGDWEYAVGDIPSGPVIYLPAERIGRRPVQPGYRATLSPEEFANQLPSETVRSLMEEGRLIVPGWISERAFIALWTILETDYSDGSIFWAESVQQAIEIIADVRIPDPSVARTINEIIDISHHCARVIVGEVIEDKWYNLGERTYPVGYVFFGGIPEIYGPEGIPLAELSSGTENTIWWVRYIALKLWWIWYKLTLVGGSTAEYPDDWHQRPAILLIDEIENHLHPTWQRRVIPALLEHFPGLQIFATTHSPFVVAGLKAGQVHMLTRDANGVVSATTNKEAIEGWTADEILRVYMGVDDPTDKDTAEAAAMLRKLRDEGPRADEREEEERQAEIRRLRQVVDRAELSGPRAAEDDRFLANLDTILERHRESQNLNQENR